MTVPNVFVNGTVADADEVNQNFNATTGSIENVLDGTSDFDTSTGHNHDGTDAAIAHGAIPIGGIISWLKTFANTPSLPDMFLECNGQTVSDGDSPYNGQDLPDLNGNAQFLYGASTSGGTKTEDYLPLHKHVLNVSSQDAIGFSLGRVNTEGENSDTFDHDGKTAGSAWEAYSVVWIMRIK